MTTTTGPSSSASPYLVPVADGYSTTSILTVGDTVGGYPMAGIADGLGAYDSGDDTFTILMNHEIKAGAGAVHAHGATGSFISKYVVKNDLTVVSGSDLIQRVMVWDAATSTWSQQVVEFSRFCSSDLAPAGAYFDAATGAGSQELIYLTGEENGATGRATATVATGAEAGTTYVLPWMGQMSFENMTTLPDTGSKTIVALTDDSNGGEVYFYVGDKKTTGNAVERAGLTGGKLYGLSIAGVADETDATDVGAGATFTLVEIPNAAAITGDELEAVSASLGVSSMARPEDSAWNPANQNGLYFTTTASFKGISRMWHLQFIDVAGNPAAGGVATVAAQSPAYDAALADAQQGGPRMMDNMTVNADGTVYIQEDPGNNPYLAGVWRLDPATGELVRILQHDPARFGEGAAGALTNDEESSGIIPVPFLGEGKYLLDVQAHYPLDATLVEGGQLLLLDVAAEQPTPTQTATPTETATVAPTVAPTESATAEPTVAPTESATAAPVATSTPKPGASAPLADTGAEGLFALVSGAAAALVLGGATWIISRSRGDA